MQHPPVPLGYSVRPVQPRGRCCLADDLALLLDRCRRVVALVESPREVAPVEPLPG